MADGTHIEWTEATWNPITGCSVLSPGCTNCYAMQLAGTRLAEHPSRAGLTTATKVGPVWTGEVRFNEGWLDQPLRWKRPRMIFVCAHGDLFHESVPDAWIDRIFAVMALCPQHTFQVLTKRSPRMRAYFSGQEWRRRVSDIVCAWPEDRVRHGNEFLADVRLLYDDALPNVWLGVSVEDQRRADERVPDLLATPAAVRWLSCEPLLGPLNVRGALRPVQPLTADQLPDSWQDFRWPEWVPDKIAERVMEFWAERAGRGPRAWLRDAISQGGPALWSVATLRMLTNAGDPVSGRFVHMWNNIGCVVGEGEFSCGSFVGSGVYTSVIANGRGLDWIVAGGESGAGARPMHPDWARALRDQCAGAGVPFFFKQWGEFAPGEIAGDYLDPEKPAKGLTFFDQRWDEEWSVPDGHVDDEPDVYRVGKARAGRLLDGVEHNGMPA